MDIAEFLQEAYRLKAVKRTGWILEGVRDPESVADHSFGTALLALVLGAGRKGLDHGKAVKMALIHDLAECRTGDILPPHGVEYHRSRGRAIPPGTHGIPKERKQLLERAAMEQLCEKLPGLLALWEELENGASAEARFVKDLDKLERLIQAVLYGEREGKEIRWFQQEENQPQDPQLREVFQEFLRSRGESPGS